MNDLIFAAVVVAGVSLGMFLVGYRLGRSRRHWPGVVALAGVGVVYMGYFLFLRDSVALVRFIPVSSVKIAGDPAPWLAALAAGILVAQHRIHALRRAALALLVVAMGWHGTATAFTRPSQQTGDVWEEGVCLQTARSTCGPAALATLLRIHGVQTNETEMARLCLTGEEGTHLTGLYRGLSLKAPHGTTPVANRMSVEELRNNPDRLPALVSLKLTRALADTDPRYVQQWGWDVGVLHSTVVLSFEKDDDIWRVWLADPGTGAELWSVRGLEELWTGEVLYLERDD